MDITFRSNQTKDWVGHSTSFQPVVPTWPSQICLNFAHVK